LASACVSELYRQDMPAAAALRPVALRHVAYTRSASHDDVPCLEC